MTTFNLKGFLFGTLFLLNSLSCVSAEDGKIVGTFADSWVENPPVGWQQLSNEKGEIGKTVNYVPLTYSREEKVYANSSGDIKGGNRNIEVPCFVKEQMQRYAISAYTFQDDYENGIWLTNGNLLSIAGIGVDVRIYLNDILKYNSSVKRSRTPLYFQCDLGKVKKGDTAYVAVSSSSNQNNNCRLYYTLESFPPAKNPLAPAKIISGDITDVVQQLEPNGRVVEKFMRKHGEQCEQALKNKPELVFIGDSITGRWTSDSMEKYFRKYRTANFGVGGDSVQNVVWRIENGVMDKIQPKVIVLLIGTNNVSSKFTPEEIFSGIATIVKLLNQKTPDSKILLMGIFPRGESIHNNPFYETIKIANANISKLADNKKIFYMDIGQKLVEPDGSISKEIMKDRLHIGAKGFEVWGSSIAPLINDMMEGK
jgi:lysophospholipase L1-like esterase